MGLSKLPPDFSVLINGAEVSTEIKKRVISLNIVDEAGIQSDSCTITLDDYDDSLQLPRTEALIDVFLGYKETGLTKIGEYFVKEITLSGGRKTMKISAHAMDKKMRSQRNKSHVSETLDQTVSEMASTRLSLDSKITCIF